MNEQEAFLELLIAAMKDAAIGGHLTQLQTQIDALKTGKPQLVRIIVVPEKMQWKTPDGRPIGAKPLDPRRN